MTTDPKIWGSDLQLLPDTNQRNDRQDGEDLDVTIRPASGRADLATYTGVDNLKQALLMRFLTPVGELAPLGHPEYGSRLFELIGQPNTQGTRNRARLYVLQLLAQEARVAEVLSVAVSKPAHNPTQITISLTLLALDGATRLNLVFPFFLEGGSTP